jgi:hypothetical protein
MPMGKAGAAMDDRERRERDRNIAWMRIQPGVQLMFQRAKLALIVLTMAFVLSVIKWAWPEAIRQALMPLAKLVVALGF